MSHQLRKTAEEAERLAKEAVVPAERNALIRFARDWRKLEARAAMLEASDGSAPPDHAAEGASPPRA